MRYAHFTSILRRLKNNILETKMKKVLFILSFGSMIIAQDTLITKKGKIYIGKIVVEDSKYVEFQPKNWNSTTKISIDKIKKLVDNNGKVLVQDNSSNFNDKTSISSMDKNKSKNSKTKNVNKKLYVSGDLRPIWNFHQPKDPFKAGILSILMPSGGHIYNEQYSKGLSFLFLVPSLYVGGGLMVSNNIDKNSDEGVLGGLIIQLTAVIFHFYNAYDAVISSHKINKEYLKAKIIEENKK